MNLRKLFSLFLSVFLVFSITLVTSMVYALEGQNFFSDVEEDSDFYEGIEFLYDEGVVEGYDDGNFEPDSTINRAEFLKILLELLYFDLEEGDCYPDVEAEDWFSPYVCTATEYDLVDGYDDGFFRPEQNINFAEASKIVAEAYDLFKDDEQEGDLWFKNDVYALEDRSAIPQSVLSFSKDLTRAEMSEILFRLSRGVDDKKTNTFDSISEGAESDRDLNEFETFRSCESLMNVVFSEDYYYDYYLEEEESFLDFASVDDSVDFSTGASAVPKSASESTNDGDFSETNVQVAGVDEADIVKTDGEYIYMVKGDDVRVIDARPAENMKELDEVDFDMDEFYPRDMYVDASMDRLIVIGEAYYYEVYPYYGDMESVGYGGDMVYTFVFDISDAENIKEIRRTGVEGTYVSSRKIDDIVYVVSSEYLYSYPDYVYPEAILPLMEDSGFDEPSVVGGCSELRYLPGHQYDKSITTVMGVPVDDVDDEVYSEMILGAGANIYSSFENLYIAQEKRSWNYYYSGEQDEEETYVHKFELEEGDIDYEGKGVVKGHILNQFSMDEHDGYFRIATTRGNVWDSSNPSSNNVYILDEDLDVVGELEGLAPGESIYSMRFMGDKGYMVTFKKVDPLFVLDLSNPRDPEVLGKLKIPGYSDYLHPYDENHIIGFGKDSVEALEEDKESRDLDFAWYQGMKIAMFDVSDVENPVELHKVVIGDRGTESELLWNHKALLFDKSRDLMAFPITVAEIDEDLKDSDDLELYTYGSPVFQGAYVFNVSVEDGFELEAKLSHYEDGEVEDKAGYYWYGEDDINRILYISNALYTVSNGMIKSYDMNDDYDELDSLIIGGDDYYNYYFEY